MFFLSTPPSALSPELPPGSAMRLKLRPLGVVGILFLLLLGFSPSIAWFLYQQVQMYSDPQLPELGTFRSEGTAPATPQQIQNYSRHAAQYQQALSGLRLSTAKQAELASQAYQLYLYAWQVLGTAKANALFKLLILETQNQNLSVQHGSMFSNPEVALSNAQQWLRVMDQSRTLSGLELDRLVLAQSPSRVSLQGVRLYRTSILAAAHALHLSPAVLAAIVDTEYAGNNVGYGLAGALRKYTDVIALRNAELYGSSGVSGGFSQTVGLAQMSWRDAMMQQERLSKLGVRISYPRSEIEARTMLQNPELNLIFTASRLRGYLAFASQQQSLSTRPTPLTDAWYYFLGPAWHNNPYKAKEGFTWAYAWNAFFKACWYEELLSRGNF